MPIPKETPPASSAIPLLLYQQLKLFIHTQRPFAPLRRRPQSHVHCEGALRDRAHEPNLSAAFRDIRPIDRDGVDEESLSSVFRTGAQQLQEEPKVPAHGEGHAVNLDRHWRYRAALIVGQGVVVRRTWFPDAVERAVKFGGRGPGQEAEKAESGMGVGEGAEFGGEDGGGILLRSRVRTCG